MLVSVSLPATCRWLRRRKTRLFIRELCDARVPVYEGAAKPLTRPLETAQFVHGEDGMADIGLPVSGRAAESGHAALKLIEAARKHDGVP